MLTLGNVAGRHPASCALRPLPYASQKTLPDQNRGELILN